MTENSKLVQLTEDESKELKPLDLSGRNLPLANDGSLMLVVQPSDGKPLTVDSPFNLLPESLEGQSFVPEESTRYYVRWGPVIGGNMFQNGKQAYVTFYR